MGLLLILPLLVSGYLVCLNDKFVFSRLHRYEGQLLYFLAAYQGLKCFGAAFFVVAAASWLSADVSFNPCLPVVKGCFPVSLDFIEALAGLVVSVDRTLVNKAQIFSFFILVGCVTCLMPYVFSFISYRAYVFKFFFRKGAYEELLGEEAQGAERLTRAQKAKARVILDERFGNFIARDSNKHHPIASVLVQSLANAVPVMVTMEDRKVYIGVVTRIGSTSEISSGLENFGISPTLSGYRDKDTLKVNFTYEYPEKKGGGHDVKPSVTYLKLESIASITLYDEGLRSRILETTSLVASSGDIVVPSIQGQDSVNDESFKSVIKSLKVWMVAKINRNRKG